MNEHIVINKDRSVVVPISEKKIGIQYDHNVNKITFDCPRYADDNEAIDMSRMHVFLNYMLPDKTTGCTILENVVVDETDPAIIHFDWVVTRNHTRVKGVMSTLICIKQTDTEGTELYHWNTDLFQQFIVGDGMECGKIVVDENPDVITQLLVRMDAVDARTSTEAIQGYVDTSVNTYLNQNPITPTDEQATTGINTYMNNHAQGCVNNYLTEHPVSPTEEQMKQGVAANSEMFQSSVDDYLGRNPLQLDNGLTETTKAAPANKVGEIQSDVTELKDDIANSKKSIAELNGKKITKFYANNLGETTLNDSDNGKIQDMILYGKSEQFIGDIELEDGTTVTVPCPDYPQEIKSVVNPVVKVCGKNLFDYTDAQYHGANVSKIENGIITTKKDVTTVLNIPVEVGKTYTVSFKLKATYTDASGLLFSLNHGKNITYPSNDTLIRMNTNFIKNQVYKPKESFVAKSDWVSLITLVDYVYDVQLEEGSFATDYEPYKEQTETLPYTLNAIPVSSGGNVTIDGQQYIADYVDIERKKLVRMVKRQTFNEQDKWKFYASGTNTVRYAYTIPISDYKDKGKGMCNNNKFSISTYLDEELTGINNELYYRLSKEKATTVSEFRTWLQSNPIEIIYELATPTETDLTDEEVQAFKELATYYPTTNVMVTSDQLDGYTTFNYPISMENGWNLIKEQLGDTRDYIYDMELQSVEAYVNSEYAVALAELEV